MAVKSKPKIPCEATKNRLHEVFWVVRFSRSIHVVCSFERMTGKKSNRAGHARRV